jgi:hypothetical protein
LAVGRGDCKTVLASEYSKKKLIARKHAKLAPNICFFDKKAVTLYSRLKNALRKKGKLTI